MTGVGPWPRRVGWLLMAAALAVGWGAKGAGLTHYGPFPAAALALLLGAIGIMLVVTDHLVRSIYATLGRARPADPLDSDRR